jgi:hypothetical protein
VGTNKPAIRDAILFFNPHTPQRNLFGDGYASEKIVRLISGAE